MATKEGGMKRLKRFYISGNRLGPLNDAARNLNGLTTLNDLAAYVDASNQSPGKGVMNGDAGSSALADRSTRWDGTFLVVLFCIVLSIVALGISVLCSRKE